jgi:hypothetical protein
MAWYHRTFEVGVVLVIRKIEEPSRLPELPILPVNSG